MVSQSLSKNQIRKLGDELRTISGKPSDDILYKLQDYRTSHKDSLADIFKILYESAKNTRPDSITTYRIKRIDSILNKLKRHPGMELDRMWDIAGCRCILKYTNDVYKLFNKIKSQFFVRKINDYYKEISESGYTSLHLYVSKDEKDSRIIEIQLRSIESHNWATFVEIIDFVYDKKIKEGQPDQDFMRFHLLLSRIDKLQFNEKSEIIELEMKYDIYSRLRSIFVRNYLEVRKKWLEIQDYKKKCFFIIETKLDSPPIIDSFLNFTDAEEEYFKRFRKNQNANILLTCVPTSNFEYISIAYSNYILTMHAFLDDYLGIISSIAIESMKMKRVIRFFKYYKKYINTIFTHSEDVNKENDAIVTYLHTHKNNKEVRYWKEDFRKRYQLRQEKIIKSSKEIQKSYPKDGLKKLLFDLSFFRIRQIIKKRSRNENN